MVVTLNGEAERVSFEKLLNESIPDLIEHSSKKDISQIDGRNYEPLVKDVLDINAKGTDFENSFELISGAAFPDIIAKKIYGIEVKTSKKDHWVTIGNSVNESSRVDTVEKIYLLFAKLVAPIDLKIRRYEECLSSISVTHYPRYKIDMNLEEGDTIFDKMGVPYDELRVLKNPVSPFVEYYKREVLKEGDDIWWIGDPSSSEDFSTPFSLRFWNNIEKIEQKRLIAEAMVLFPEIIGNSAKKYARISMWLIKEKGVVCPNMRDPFSGSGRKIIEINGKTYPERGPKVLYTYIKHLSEIYWILGSLDRNELESRWEQSFSDEDRMETWIKLVEREYKKKEDDFKFDFLREFSLYFKNEKKA